MKIIAFLNQKGGVGKTTSCHNVGAALSLCGFKCLLIDADPQGSLSQSAGYDNLGEDDLTIYEVLTGSDVNEAIVSREGSFDLLLSDTRLSAGEIELVNADRRNYLLKDMIDRIEKSYDFILIDCPPSLSIFTIMALTATQEVIIPVQPEYLPLKGVAQIRETIDVVKERFNHELKISGILVTLVNSRRNLDKEVVEILENVFGDLVFKTKISINAKIAEAPSYGLDVIAYSPKSKGAQQYRELAQEIIEHETTGGR